MLSSQDFFYYMAGISLTIIAIAITYAVIQLGQTLKTINEISQEIKSGVKNVSFIKNGIKVGILSVIQKIIGKGGDDK